MVANLIISGFYYDLAIKAKKLIKHLMCSISFVFIKFHVDLKLQVVESDKKHTA